MPIPKGRTGQVPIGQDNPPILSTTHYCTICFPAQRVLLSSVLLTQPHGDISGDAFAAGMAAGEVLGTPTALGRGFLP